MDDINAELGNAAGTTISLDDAAVRALAGVSSGTISLSDFYGASLFTIGFDSDISRTDSDSRPSLQKVTFTLKTNATTSVSGGSGGTIPTRWGTPTTTGIGSSYEARVQVNTLQIFDGTNSQDFAKFAGVNITSTGNTPYYALSSDRSIEVSGSTNNGGDGFTRMSGRIYIREIANPSNIANTTFTLTANADL